MGQDLKSVKRFSDKLQAFAKSLDASVDEVVESGVEQQAALHNPDQVAGGFADRIGGVGDTRINSSIGSQWRYRIDIVDEQINKMASEMTSDQLRSTYLNVKLTY